MNERTQLLLSSTSLQWQRILIPRKKNIPASPSIRRSTFLLSDFCNSFAFPSSVIFQSLRHLVAQLSIDSLFTSFVDCFITNWLCHSTDCNCLHENCSPDRERYCVSLSLHCPSLTLSLSLSLCSLLIPKSCFSYSLLVNLHHPTSSLQQPPLVAPSLVSNRMIRWTWSWKHVEGKNEKQGTREHEERDRKINRKEQQNTWKRTIL